MLTFFCWSWLVSAQVLKLGANHEFHLLLLLFLHEWRAKKVVAKKSAQRKCDWSRALVPKLLYSVMAQASNSIPLIVFIPLLVCCIAIALLLQYRNTQRRERVSEGSVGERSTFWPNPVWPYIYYPQLTQRPYHKYMRISTTMNLRNWRKKSKMNKEMKTKMTTHKKAHLLQFALRRLARNELKSWKEKNTWGNIEK